ncbi:hypothetical protein [Williamsia deligens]|uniref:Uncharacterized protein n=1 Tax=Williamsia deligens TaxID=321325 RepID=A0ABW3GBT5_9NOCA|nr:hypothetical protein [Williamsia deligens]MCP2192846.1 hypothetical protein [Williamsia deligens]
MADKSSKKRYVDNGWPQSDEGDHEHAVSEFAASISGALSPFGETEFPLPVDQLPYTHAKTTVNR